METYGARVFRLCASCHTVIFYLWLVISSDCFMAFLAILPNSAFKPTRLRRAAYLGR